MLGLLLLSVLLAGAAVPVAAQTSAPASLRASPAAVLKSALRSAAAAQSRHHAERGRYAAAAEQLRLKLEPGVDVEVMAAAPSGWQARAVHRDQPGKSCVIFVGKIDGLEWPRTDGDREMAGEDGVPLCDRMR
jgi:hypothetical protein